jgi:hypothetical protein
MRIPRKRTGTQVDAQVFPLSRRDEQEHNERRESGMASKATITLPVIFSLVCIMSGVLPRGAVHAAEDSKLTIAYIADEIGRIEPCG